LRPKSGQTRRWLAKSALCHVWTAPSWQGKTSRRRLGRCSHVFGLLARHTRPLAIMPSADQVPVKSPHSRCTGTSGLSRSPDRPALHYVLSALPTFTSRQMPARSWSRRKCGGFLVAITLDHHGPCYSCDLVGERDRGDLGRPPRQQCRKPGPMFGAMDLGIADHRQRASGEQAAQIAITLFADTAELVLAPARVLLRHEPDPGRKIPPGSESLRISDAGDQSGGQRRTDARDLIQPLARLARSVPGHDLAIEVQNLCL